MNTLASPMPCTPRNGSSTHSEATNAEATVATAVSIAPQIIRIRRLWRSPKRASARAAQRRRSMLNTARFRPMSSSLPPKLLLDEAGDQRHLHADVQEEQERGTGAP